MIVANLRAARPADWIVCLSGFAAIFAVVVLA